MPLEVKDINWSETELYVVLNVPLKGASAKNVDIFSTNYYIKVSYPPYFFELALLNEIDDESSKVTISNKQVTFHLKKKAAALWGQLHSSQQKDKIFMKDLRASALEYRQKKDQAKVKLKNETKDKEKKFSVREQMKIDNIESTKIKELKNEEAEIISEDMDKWKKQNSESVSNYPNKKNSLQEEDRRSKDQSNKNTTPVSKTPSCNLNSSNDKHVEEEVEKSIPQPRSCGSIQVSFTPRILPTPARESKLPEEEEWLKKLAEFNQMKNTNNSDATDIEEMNPMWLKDKGNDFYKKGNYVAAINAYTSAIMLDSKIPMLYANRAACHLSLKQYSECIQDCTCALELYIPPVPANIMSRCRALTRRGTAYFYREEYVDCLRDYEAAMKLDPKNDELKSDASKIRKIIQGEEDSS